MRRLYDAVDLNGWFYSIMHVPAPPARSVRLLPLDLVHHVGGARCDCQLVRHGAAQCPGEPSRAPPLQQHMYGTVSDDW